MFLQTATRTAREEEIWNLFVKWYGNLPIEVVRIHRITDKEYNKAAEEYVRFLDEEEELARQDIVNDYALSI